MTVFEDAVIGAELPGLLRGPITLAHVVRWTAAIENWHRIHYDAEFAIEHEALPGMLINGSLKQHLLMEMLRAWAEPAGWLARIRVRFSGMDVVGNTLTAAGTVVELVHAHGFGVARCELAISNQRGEVTTTGDASVALPFRAGPPLPYPFPGLER